MSDVPSPVLALTAAQLLERIGADGGRTFRTQGGESARTYVLTEKAELAEWLIRLGGRPNAQGIPAIRPLGGYYRARGVKEWDIWIDTIPVSGLSVREALGD